MLCQSLRNSQESKQSRTSDRSNKWWVVAYLPVLESPLLWLLMSATQTAYASPPASSANLTPRSTLSPELFSTPTIDAFSRRTATTCPSRVSHANLAQPTAQVEWSYQPIERLAPLNSTELLPNGYASNQFDLLSAANNTTANSSSTRSPSTPANELHCPTEQAFLNANTTLAPSRSMRLAQANSSTTEVTSDSPLPTSPQPSNSPPVPSNDSEGGDDELGILRLQDVDPVTPTTDPSLHTEETTADDELGILRLLELEPLPEPPLVIPPAAPAPPIAYFLGRLSYFRSNNLFLDDTDPVNDQLVTGGASLLLYPRLDAQTDLIASVEGNLVRYSDLSFLDYNELTFRAAIRHYFNNQIYGQLSWTNQQLFDQDGGDRFSNDHSFRVTAGRRDSLTNDLVLDTFYQFRAGFSDPIDRSRLSHTVGAFLNYYLDPNLQVGLDYRLVLTDFTHQDRNDFYNEIVAQLTYDISRQTSLSVYGGISFGESTEPDIDFDSFLFGLLWDISIPLF